MRKTTRNRFFMTTPSRCVSSSFGNFDFFFSSLYRCVGHSVETSWLWAGRVCRLVTKFKSIGPSVWCAAFKAYLILFSCVACNYNCNQSEQLCFVNASILINDDVRPHSIYKWVHCRSYFLGAKFKITIFHKRMQFELNLDRENRPYSPRAMWMYIRLTVWIWPNFHIKTQIGIVNHILGQCSSVRCCCRAKYGNIWRKQTVYLLFTGQFVEL